MGEFQNTLEAENSDSPAQYASPAPERVYPEGKMGDMSVVAAFRKGVSFAPRRYDGYGSAPTGETPQRLVTMPIGNVAMLSGRPSGNLPPAA